jgi:hypothetical protein
MPPFVETAATLEGTLQSSVNGKSTVQLVVLKSG